MPSPTFIIGYPKTKSEKAQSRSAVRANASRLRWRKGTISSAAGPVRTAGDPTPRIHPPTTGHCVLPYLEGHYRSQSLLTNHEAALMPVYPPLCWDEQQQEPNEDAGHAQMLLALSSPTPLDILTLALPVPLPRLVLFSEHEVRFLLSQLYETFSQALPANSSGKNELAATWVRKIMSDSGVLYAYTFSQLMRNKHRHCLDRKAERQLLHSYSETITYVNTALSNYSTACNDSTLLAVFTLAYHSMTLDSRPQPNRPRSPAQGPLNSLRLLNLYGGPLEAASMHREGLLKMIELRGGIEKFTLPGLGGLLCYADLIFASRTVQRPRLPFAPCLGVNFESALARVRRADHPLGRLGRGFSALGLFDAPPKSRDLQIALRGLSQYTLAVDDYLAARPEAPSLAILEELRCFVMHGILSLTPDVNEARPTGAEVLYTCQLAALTYGMLCVFPLPAAPFELLASRIRLCLSRCDFGRAWSEAPDLVLWTAFIGGVAAQGLDNGTRSWYVRLVDRCRRMLRIDSWTALRDDVLLEFLWLPATNDADGVELWDEVEASSAFALGTSV
ncbi:uncharacterized protein PV07_01484 [Cladophialophora immunda]|uniref:Transcription factor domain-containing protein n=1 Tax=Cladophialophora immunda TaxID=569365 RepID=A0A0D2A368_9EURO|nr:uncharacterized protein PV07_01484 [Cladophialophora immunda]KIW34726.1 hypothetical protein PV07_01484 [Cladophialophora immunda]